jgi:type IV secretory pathway TraG/TraD family ATPase VirD4
MYVRGVGCAYPAVTTLNKFLTALQLRAYKDVLSGNTASLYVSLGVCIWTKICTPPHTSLRANPGLRSLNSLITSRTRISRPSNQ